MRRYIAFLRAINVGGHVVKMERLRQLFESLGFSEVETFIASGNVIFQSPSKDQQALEKKIEQHLEDALGYAVAALIRSESELVALVSHEAFPAPELAKPGHALYVAFLPAAPGSEVAKKLAAFRNENVDFQLHGREIYWLFRTLVSDSGFSGARLERALGMLMTIRNINTPKRILAKFRASPRTAQAG